MDDAALVHRRLDVNFVHKQLQAKFLFLKDRKKRAPALVVCPELAL
jgi:hypothetical protein